MGADETKLNRLSDITYALFVQEKIQIPSGGEQQYRFSSVCGRIFASVFFQAHTASQARNVLTLVSDTGEAAVSVQMEGKAFFAWNGAHRELIGSFQEDTWFRIALSVDTVRQTYSVFLDGEKCLSHAAFRETAKAFAACTVSARADGFTEQHLCVYENPVQSVQQAAAGRRIYDAKALGVEADGSVDVTQKLQTLIDCCAREGGGVLYLRAGTYLSGMLEFRQGSELYLETDAVLQGTLESSAYVSKHNPNWNMAHQGPQMALVYAENLTRFVIQGGGTIDGGGDFSGDYGSESSRPSAILLVGCTNVRIRDVYVENAGMWTIPAVDCTRLYVRNVHLRSFWFPNRDGLDLCDCHEVLVEHCSFLSDDDTVCLKSGSERGCNQILVRFMMLQSTMANAVKFGTGSYGAFTNCTVCDSVIKHTRLGGICVESVDGAKIQSLCFKNLDIGWTGSPFFVVLGDRGSIPPQGKRRIGSIENLQFCKICAHDLAQSDGCYLSGMQTEKGIFPIRNLLFKNVQLTARGGVQEMPAEPPEYDGRYPEVNMFGKLPACGYWIRHAEAVRFENCTTAVERADVRQPVVTADAPVLQNTISDKGAYKT